MKNLLLLPFLFGHLVSCSQTNKTIVKAQAFFTVPMPGTIPVDDEGKTIPLKRDTLYTVIAEVHGKAPQWIAAWIGTRCFTIMVSPVQDREVVAGKRFSDEAPVVVRSAARNSLWELQLTPADAKTKPALTMKQGEALLVGKLSGKPVYYKISVLTELASPAYQ